MSFSSALFSEVEYEIQDIGTLQTHSSEAIAINNEGQILGWYNLDGSPGGKHFFVRDRDGTFHEIENYKNWIIDWKYLTDNGNAYGKFNDIGQFGALCVWDSQNGVSNLGNLPGKEISAINNSGQVLIKSVINEEDGKSIIRPVIWQNGKTTKLKGLEGNLGIESNESYGFDINNKGEVVGQSVASIIYKNEIYKQTHAVKWSNGQVIDLHNKVPKALKTNAIAINDLGDILIYAGETRDYLPKYLAWDDGNVTVFSYDLNKLNNIGCVYNVDYDYGVPVRDVRFSIQDRNVKDIFHSYTIMVKLSNDSNSIWTDKLKLVALNDNNEMIVQGVTIYGENHAMLLTPVKSN